MDFSNELLLIDKPKGITSFDVIRRLRHHYSDAHEGQKAPKFGHAGTLDPLATGMMLVGVGKGTKRLTELTKLDKEYVADLLIGRSTTTGDTEGGVMEEKEVNETALKLESSIRTALEEMIGLLTLPVSAYSAIKRDGVPMYKRARKAAEKGEVITDVPVREMKVYEAELLGIDTDAGDGFAVARIRFKVGSGTYIRSLGEELGRRLGYPACLQDLRRTRVGEYRIEDAFSLPEKN